jgi:hypothetical protein
MQPYGRFRSAALGLIVVLCSAGGCTERTVPEAEQDPKGDEADDEIIKVCEQTCPMQFECGFASEGKTLAGCLEDCPASMRVAPNLSGSRAWGPSRARSTSSTAKASIAKSGP